MTGLQLNKTRFAEGVWEGLLTGVSEAPKLEVLHHGKSLVEPVLTRHEEAGWRVRVTIPAEVLGDGVQTIAITDTASGETLEAVHIIAGEALDDDLRAEVQLLREELDMLKRAFRRHCVETA